MNDNDLALVSVIMPIYNTAEYLSKSVESILSQTYKNLEILLVDDGSTDDSPELCDKLAKSDSRIKVIHKTNGGAASARNIGIDNATGEYLFFLDSDDWTSLNAIEELLKTAKAKKSSICVMPTFEPDDSNQNFVPSNEVYAIDKEEALLLLSKDKWDIVVVNNKLFHKSLFDNLRFNGQMRFGEDRFIMVDILDRCDSIAFTSNVCLYRNPREDSISRAKTFSIHQLDDIKSCERLIEYFTKTKRLNCLQEHNHIFLKYLFMKYLRVYRSEIENKEAILKDISQKLNNLFASMPLSKWKFKEIRRFYLWQKIPSMFAKFTSIK